jgi:hypothetical protein
MEINKLLESANPYKSLQSDATRLASKWNRTGLLKGLEGEDVNNMSMMLENQAKQLVVEQSSTGGGVAGGSFTQGPGEQWAGIALPLVRKVFGMISAKDFVSVQPMNLPSGLVFFLDFKYGTNQPGTPAYQNQSVYGNLSSSRDFRYGGAGNSEGGLYGGGRFGYATNFTSSVGEITSASSTPSATVLNVVAITGADLDTYINYDSDFSASLVANNVSAPLKVTLGAVSTLLPTADFNAVRSFEFSNKNNGGSFAKADYFPLFTKYDATADTITFLMSGSATNVATSSVSYSLAPADNRRGDFEDQNTALNGNNAPITIPEFNVEMRSEAIVAKTKKLKAQWTPEFAQDLNAYHSLDAEAELTSMMSEYVSLEIDMEILDMLIENAPTVEYWSAKSNYTWNGSGFTPGTAGDGGFYNTQGQWFQTLGTKVQKLSNEIHRRTLRGGANFMVVSPTVATVLESIPGYAANTDGSTMGKGFAFGVQKVGALNSRFTVYKNPYMTENLILMGYRGSQFLETGAVYAPYIPLIMTPLVYDPETFTPRKGLMTRYAKKMVRPEFYGKIYVHGLETI